MSSFFLVRAKVNPQNSLALGIVRVKMDLSSFVGQKLFFDVLFLFRQEQLRFSGTSLLVPAVDPNFTTREYNHQPSS